MLIKNKHQMILFIFLSIIFNKYCFKVYLVLFKTQSLISISFYKFFRHSEHNLYNNKVWENFQFILFHANKIAFVIFIKKNQESNCLIRGA